jgi:hypothetical protein
MITINRGYGVNSFSGQNPSISFGYDEQANKDLREFANTSPFKKEILTLQSNCNRIERKILKDEKTETINQEDVSILASLKLSLINIVNYLAPELLFGEREMDHYHHKNILKNPDYIKEYAIDIDDNEATITIDLEDTKIWRGNLATILETNLNPFDLSLNTDENTKDKADDKVESTFKEIVQNLEKKYSISPNEINMYE